MVVVLGAAACTGGTDGGDPTAGDETTADGVTATATDTATPTAEDATTPAPSPTDGPTAAPTTGEQALVAPADIPALDARCTIEPSQGEIQTIEFSVPSSWQIEDGECGFLDPDLTELPEETEVGAAIIVSVSDAAYRDVATPGPSVRDVTTWVGARANFQSVRRTATSTGEGLGPEGMPSTSWIVDLDAGTDEQGGALVMSTGPVEGDAHALAEAVLDRIAQTVIIQPPAEGAATSPGEQGFAVTRLEGGGTPATVTYDGDCFRLRPGGPSDDATDELCDLDPTDGDVVAGVLGDQMLVGHVGPRAVTVTAPELSGPYGIATPIEGGSLFAFPVDTGQLPTTVVARTAGGGVVGQGEVGQGG